MSSLALTPTEFLKYALDPISKIIDENGGPHMLIGIVASGGAPQIYLTGNCTDNLQKEICEALAAKLQEMAGKATSKATSKAPSIII